MSYGDVNNSEDILDSRQVIERIEELTALYDAAMSDDPEEVASADFGDSSVEEVREELRILRAFAQEGEDNVSDWSDGETLVRDSYFEEYAEQLAEDIGAIDRDARWPLNHIDWEAAAEDLKQDYVELDFDGVSYWARM